MMNDGEMMKMRMMNDFEMILTSRNNAPENVTFWDTSSWMPTRTPLGYCDIVTVY